jgi:hypothetical protein
MINDKMIGHSIGLNGPLRVELLPNGISAILVRPFIVRCKSGRIVEVPAGFQTDFASVPRAFWRLIPPWGPYSPAAVVHDYLYTTGLVSRAEADKIFLELMKRLDVPAWKRNVMYWAVRMAGASRYTMAKTCNV